MPRTVKKAALCLAALAGAIALFIFAEFVMQTPPDPVKPRLVNTKVHTIRAPDGLIDFAKTNKSFRSNVDLREALEKHNLHNVWYSIAVTMQYEDGSLLNHTGFHRVGELDDMFGAYLGILLILAGETPEAPGMDYSELRVVAFDNRYINVNPFDAMKEIEAE